MSPNRSISWSAVRVAVATAAVAGLAIVAACSEGGVASNIGAPSLRKGESVGPSIANATIARVCVTGPDGTYNFVNGNDSTGPGGTTVYNAANGVPYSLVVNGGNPSPCVDVVTRTGVTNPAALSDDFSAATVTQTSGPASTAYSTTNCVDDPGVATSVPCANPSRIHANKFHGSVATFVNVSTAGTGCTYTQGWYKNQGNASVPSSSFFGTAASWKVVLATKPKGNNYYNLADQYIAAKLGIGGGSPPSAVAQAIIDAQTFFTGRALGSTAGYSTSTLAAIAAILDSFNNGNYAGWPHCS